MLPKSTFVIVLISSYLVIYSVNSSDLAIAKPTSNLSNDPKAEQLDITVLFNQGTSNQEIINIISEVGIILRQDPDGAYWVHLNNILSIKDSFNKLKNNKAVKQFQFYTNLHGIHYLHSDLFVIFYSGIEKQKKNRIISTVGVVFHYEPDGTAFVNITNGMSYQDAINQLKSFKEVKVVQRQF